MADLGSELRNVRHQKGLSLRDVEAKTGVSNGYLSQLEQGKISKPTPHILHSLSEFYGMPYTKVMRLAGYVMPNREKVTDERLSLGGIALSAIDDLTPEEKEKVLEYVALLRLKKKQAKRDKER